MMKSTKLLLLLTILVSIISGVMNAQIPPLKWMKAGIKSDIEQLAVSPNGNTVAILYRPIDSYSHIAIYDVNNRKIFREYYVKSSTRLIRYSYDSKMLFIKDIDGIQEIDIQNDTFIKSDKKIGESILSYSLSQNSDIMVASYYTYEVQSDKGGGLHSYVWGVFIKDFDSGLEFLLREHSFRQKYGPYTGDLPNRAVCISNDSNLFAVGNENGEIDIYGFALYRYDSLKRVNAFAESKLTSISFSENDDNLIATHRNGDVFLWNIKSNKLIDSIKIREGIVSIIDNKNFPNKAILRCVEPGDNTLDYYYIYDYSGNKIVDSLIIDSKVYPNYSLTDDMNTIVYGEKGEVFLENLSTSEKIDIGADLPDNIYVNLTDETKDYILSSAGDSKIRFHSKFDGEIDEIRNYDIDHIDFMKVSRDYKYILLNDSSRFQIWNLEDHLKISDFEIDSVLSFDKVYSWKFLGKRLIMDWDPITPSFWIVVDSTVIKNIDIESGEVITEYDTQSSNSLDLKECIKDLSINSSGDKLIIGNSIQGEDFYHYFNYCEIKDGQLLFLRSFSCLGIADGSKLYSDWIDNDSFIYFVQEKSIKYSSENKADIHLISMMPYQKDTEYYSDDKFSAFEEMYHTSNPPLSFFYLNNGIVKVYNRNKKVPLVYFDSYLNLRYLTANEAESELYILGHNGTLKCYDMSAFIDDSYKELEADSGLNLFCYPNPTSGLTNLSIDEKITGVQSIKLYDDMGNIVKILSNNIDDSDNSIGLDLSDLAIGKYIIVAFTKDRTYTSSINIVR